MHIRADTLDDLLNKTFRKVLRSKCRIQSSRGEVRELFGVLLELANPRARLSRTETKGKLFSSLGELLWYLSRENDLEFIAYYLSRYREESEDGKTVYGAYGPRLFNMRGQINQIDNVLTLLRERPTSRRAVIQLFDAGDLVQHRKEIPCTCTLQLVIRSDRLDVMVCMRSNDVFFGLPHDVFAFTMLQEILARSLGIEIGTYKHAVGSLHLYEPYVKPVRQYLAEGWQSSQSMPAIPAGDPWPAISVLLEAEQAIRSARRQQISLTGLDPYWADLVRILQILAASKAKDKETIKQLKQQMASKVFQTYIER